MAKDFLKTASKSSIEVLDLSGNALTTVEACVEINPSQLGYCRVDLHAIEPDAVLQGQCRVDGEGA